MADQETQDTFKGQLIKGFKKFGGLCSRFYERHNYFTSFLLASALTAIAVFYRSHETYFQDQIPELFEFIEIQLSDTPSSSKASGEIIDPSQVEASIEANAVDISFLEGVKGPRIIGGLKKDYPKIAEREEVEAVVLLEVIISASGKVVKVNPLGVKLNKALPKALQNTMRSAFSRSAIKMLKIARFTPPEINGKNVPIKLEIPLDFVLEN